MLSDEKEIAAYRAFARDVARAQAVLAGRLQEIGATPPWESVPNRIDALVRISPGPTPTIYHWADGPCDRVRGEGRTLDNFRRMPEQDAVAKNLRRCSACRWPDQEKA